MAWSEYVELSAVFADECPSNASVAGHFCGTVDRLYRADGAGIVFDEVATIWRDLKGAAGVKDDVDDVVRSVSARQKGSDEVGVKVGACQV